MVVGLGNPGRRYSRSRHNVGFRVLDCFAEQHAFGSERRKFRALVREKTILTAPGERGEVPPSPRSAARSMKVLLVKPQTYMNLSGQAVRDVLGYFGGHAPGVAEDLTDKLLVVYDDLDLPPGKLRFRARGSSGGHRGLQSVMTELGQEAFSRLRIGIGRSAGEEAADFVLEQLSSTAWEMLEQTAKVAADTLPVWIEEGVEVCMNRFNADTEVATGDETRGPREGGRTGIVSDGAP